MEFTYNAYKDLIQRLLQNGYSIANYKNYKRYSKPVILRHDIDYSLEKALELAKVENSIGGGHHCNILCYAHF